MRLPLRATSIPYGPSYPQNTERYNALEKQRVTLSKQIKRTVHTVLKKCQSNKNIQHPDNTSCAVLWDQLDEYTSKLHEVESTLDDYWECWDNIECKIYDV